MKGQNLLRYISILNKVASLTDGLSWGVNGVSFDDTYVNVTGDTMTGLLTLSAGVPNLNATPGYSEMRVVRNSTHASDHILYLGYSDDTAANTSVRIYSDTTFVAGFTDNAVNLSSLAGSGSRVVSTDASGNLSASNAPTFTDFTNAVHDHLDTDDGGVLTPGAFGLLSIQQTANYTGANNNSAQKVFNESTNGAANVAASTTYFMEGFYYISTVGATSHTLSILFGGTATLTSMDYSVVGPVNAPTTDAAVTTFEFHKTDATALVVSNAAATATHHKLWLRGVVRINGAGTFIPQYQWSAAPGTAGVTGRNSFLRLTPIGTNTVGTVGSWG